MDVRQETQIAGPTEGSSPAIIRPVDRLEGIATPPGDKSISHRAILLNAISHGTAIIANLCVGDDRDAILRCMRRLGARIKRLPNHQHEEGSVITDCFMVRGGGRSGLTEPTGILHAGNSGTTMRLVAGLLASQPFFSVLSGDRSLRRRPMDRIIKPLIQMGATIMGRDDNTYAPFAISGGNLHGIDYELPVASAQLKSCLLIAGLSAKGETVLTEPAPSRDHTERLMTAMGANLTQKGRRISIWPGRLTATDVRVPGDISGAAFWMVAGCCHPNASIRIKGIGTNPSRTGVLDALKRMGARIHLEKVHEDGGEPAADILVESSELVGIDISGDMIPRVIDELPLLALAACFARGTTVIRDAKELRVKESDRITATVDGLTRLGADVEELEDGMIIRGGGRLTGATCDSYGDHRIAMAMGIAGMIADGETTITGAGAAHVSYPGFWDTVENLSLGLSTVR